MKKILLSITAAVLTTISVNAQDFGFETWVASGNQQDPTGWASFNVLTTYGMTQTVFKETTAPYAGTAAAKIVTQAIPPLIPVPGYDTVGLLIIGSVDIAKQKINYGAPYTNRPEFVKFVTKYEPVNGDTASVSVQITHYNTTTKLTEIIATGTWSTTATATSWTQQSLKLTYDANLKTVAPDTIRFMASASSLFRPKINSTLYIDDIGFSGYVSTNNIDGVSNNVSVYPSPAKENVTISISVNAAAVEIFDLTGRSIGVFPMTNNKATIETANYSAGMYLYNVLGAQNNVLGRGKFEVVE
jgi:hypothetical protein